MSLNAQQIQQAKAQVANGKVQIQRQELDLKRAEQRQALYADEIAHQKARHELENTNLANEHAANDSRVEQLRAALKEGQESIAKAEAAIAEAEKSE